MIYITGDTHGEQSRILYMQRHYDLGKDDILIICGDFGYLWDDSPSERKFLDRIERWAPYTLCFIDGNHENFQLLNGYPQEIWNGGKIHRIRNNIFHLMRGQIFTLENRTFFTMGGAYSVDQMMREIDVSYWMEELPSDDEYKEALINLANSGYKVDYVITHTAPASIIYRLSIRKRFLMDDHDMQLTRFLDDLRYKLDFKKWFFGHFHDDMEMYEKFYLLYTDVYQIDE